MSSKLRGGNWNNQANAGVFELNLNNARTNANGNIGFRAAFLRSPSNNVMLIYRESCRLMGLCDSVR